jgi:hypothetical protein
MKRALVAIAVLTVACTPQNNLSVRKASVSAINATYSTIPNSTNGILSFDLLIRNEASVPLTLGCGLLIVRQSSAGSKPIQQPACSLPDWDPRQAPSIGANTTDTIRLRVNIPQSDIDEVATYKAVPSIFFGPDFKKSSSFPSAPFRVAMKGEIPAR